MVARPALIATALVASACQAKDAARGDAVHLGTLTEELRIGNADGEGPAAFARITALEVDRWGRIYVLEEQAQEIRVFDSTGVHLRTIGRKGHGPMEFEQANGLAWDTQGRLWIVDQQNARYTVIDTAGHLLFTRPRRISGWFTWRWQGGIDTAGAVYEWYRKPGEVTGDRLLRYDSTLVQADTLPLPEYEGEQFKYAREGMRVSAAVPFTPTLVWTFDPRGYVWFGVSAPYRIYQRTLSGDTVRVFEHPYDPLPVTAAERDSAIARYDWFTKQGGEIDASRIPSHKPAFTRFVVGDDGALWVGVVAADSLDGRLFDRFRPDGSYEGRIQSDVRFAPSGPLIVRRSGVYGVTLDTDGVPFVVRARVR